MLDITIELRISEPEMIRFFREKGIVVEEVKGIMKVAAYHNQTEDIEYEQWVVINPNTKEQIPMEEKYKEIVSLHTRNLIVNSIDRFAVYNSFM